MAAHCISHDDRDHGSPGNTAFATPYTPDRLIAQTRDMRMARAEREVTR